MSKINPNDPAFPLTYKPEGSLWTWDRTRGMTIRAEIASRIMAGIASRESTGERETKYIVSEVIDLTDALIAELNKEPT